MFRCRFFSALLFGFAMTFFLSFLPAAFAKDVVKAACNQLPAQSEATLAQQAAQPWVDFPDPSSLDDASAKRLKNGEVLVDSFDVGNIKFILARIGIDQSPEDVWPVLANPYEFENKICPRMKSVQLLLDRQEQSVMRCDINVCALMPKFTYTVESKYQNHNQVQFRRLAGSLRDFRGCWMLRPLDGGTGCEVLYSMYVDPGVPLPKWLVREALKSELPHTLTSLRERVNAIYVHNGVPESRHTSAAGKILLRNQALPLTASKGSI